MHPYGFEEVVPKGCSKAGGIDYIVEHLGESLASCYVFGDSTNDLSMLTHVKNSIAMGNSYPEVLANTSYVTKKEWQEIGEKVPETVELPAEHIILLK